jgi:hypothetical protein
MHASPTSTQLQGRKTIGIVTFLVCCLLSSARLVHDAPNPRNPPGDIARRSDQRFAMLKTALPARGVVGYIGEPGIPALSDYYLAQYALAPVVIDHSTNHALVVGNFSPQSTPGALPPGLHLINDFGGGVFLFSNNPFAEEDKR